MIVWNDDGEHNNQRRKRGYVPAAQCCQLNDKYNFHGTAALPALYTIFYKPRELVRQRNGHIVFDRVCYCGSVTELSTTAESATKTSLMSNMSRSAAARHASFFMIS